MFNFFIRMKQITGHEPVQTLVLGEFAFEENRFENAQKNRKKRQNISVLLHFFETNSAQLVIRTYDSNETFHLLSKPFNFELFQVEVECTKTRRRFLFVKESKVCALVDGDNDSVRVFIN